MAADRGRLEKVKYIIECLTIEDFLSAMKLCCTHDETPLSASIRYSASNEVFQEFMKQLLSICDKYPKGNF